MKASMRIDIAGENALILYFAEVASEQSAADVFAATQALEALVGHGIIDLIPSYASLLVVYDDEYFDVYRMRYEITQRMQAENQNFEAKESRTVELPVYYGTDAGPDLEALAKQANLSVEEVIEIHQSQSYQVFAIGFAPGFAFLGEVDQRIAAPRKATPRKAVPKGAVAIADRQTAVYPSVSPGGWNLIGLCPTAMFDASATPCMPVEVGDKVKFYAINKDEYLALGGEL
ncbi:5-oxoprolinase subunit PxpB [Marinomonas algicola]|jgi:KipI family sensor histidine kinase inhibitor|uniref:5-oxoprolinase subunit PxpB n=1 Tax=Marinomonas algicola TaxID=2773454 RepID=UPI001EFF4ACE|nr:5-oxoprolinase subunit PxpB [Marinomonas algicola]